MQITLGNLNHGHVFTGTPTKASQLFTAAGDWKFTVTAASPGQKIIVQNDLPFVKFMGLEQSQNAPCNFGPTTSSGVLVNDAPRSAVAHNQAQLLIFKAPKSGYCDITHATHLTFELGGLTGCTFEYNAG